MSRKIEDILDECLRLMAQGRGVEECLSRYPGQAEELEPLLRIAELGQRAMAPPHPSPGARAAGRQRLLAALTARRERRRHFFPLRGWALATASLVVALLLGSGTVLASFQSLPDEPLYPVKEAVERAQLALAPSSISRARTLVHHSDNRLQEIDALEKRGKAPAAEAVRQRLKGQLRRAEALAVAVGQRGGDGEAVIAIMERNLAQHKARLLATTGAPPGLEHRPRALSPQARRAVAAALDDYEQALERLKARKGPKHNGKLPRHPKR